MINLKKKLVFLSIFSCVNFAISLAQDSVFTRNITVEREYQPILKNTGKLNVTPKLIEPEVKPLPAQYTDLFIPLSINNNIHPLSSTEFFFNNRVEQNNFLQLGLGNFYNSSANFLYSLLNRPNTKLDFYMNHIGTFGDKLHSTTKSGLVFDQQLKSLHLFAGVETQHERLKFYGFNFNDSASVQLNELAKNHGSSTFIERQFTSITRAPHSFTLQELSETPGTETFWHLNAFGGLQSLPLTSDINYSAKLNYHFFQNKFGIKENRIHLTGKVIMPFHENNIGLNVQLHQIKYTTDKAPLFNFWDYYSVIMLNPFYVIEQTNLKLRMGLKAAFSMKHGRSFSPAADIAAEWNVFPHWMTLYGGISGDYEINNMDRIFSENCFLFSDTRIKDTYTPFHSYGGIKIKPAKNFLVDFFADYQFTDQQFFYVNKEYVTEELNAPDSVLFTNRFNVVYSDAYHFKIGGRAAYNDEKNRFNMEFRTTYNLWDTKETALPWLQPTWETDLRANLGITSNITTSLYFFYKTGRYAQLGNRSVKMDNIMDVNLGISYIVSKSLSVYLHLNNLLNNKYQYFYGYDVQGFNLMTGVAFSF